MILALDCETSDLYKDDLPENHPSQPWVVSIAAELCGYDGVARDWMHTRIRANGRTVKQGASAVHGVSTSQAARSGVPEIVALGMFCHFVAQASHLVGFGNSFDVKVIKSVLLRANKSRELIERPGLEIVDTMPLCTPICKIAPPIARDDQNYKWPKLDEACAELLGERAREGAHSAWDDMQRAKRIYFELVKRGIVENPAAMSGAA